MPALALDIGTYSIKALSGKPGKSVTVEKVAEVFNTTGLALPTDDASMDKMAALIDAVINDYNLPRSDVRLALPESVVSAK